MGRGISASGWKGVPLMQLVPVCVCVLLCVFLWLCIYFSVHTQFTVYRLQAHLLRPFPSLTIPFLYSFLEGNFSFFAWSAHTVCVCVLMIFARIRIIAAFNSNRYFLNYYANYLRWLTEGLCIVASSLVLQNFISMLFSVSVSFSLKFSSSFFSDC